MGAPTQAELEAAHCWDPIDVVPGRPAMTAFRREVRLHQSRWREAQGHPIGTQPIRPAPGKPSRPVGSRLPLAFAEATGANFVSPTAWAAAQQRLAIPEPHQTIDKQRLLADLLWSTALACNLFAGADDDAIHRWFPGVPGRVVGVRLLHSPGRLDPSFCGNLITFDAAVALDLGDGAEGVLAFVTPYHDRLKREMPKPQRLARYVEVHDRSGAFVAGALDDVNGTDLTVLWLQHLLLLSMLQHPSGRWRWARLVLVHPAGNVDFAAAASERYGPLVADGSFASVTLEDLLPPGPLRERYVP